MLELMHCKFSKLFDEIIWRKKYVAMIKLEKISFLKSYISILSLGTNFHDVPDELS